MTDRTYISAADTAKLLRTALKTAFPTTRFSVRSKTYSGGASIDVKWIDGPLQAQVERVAKQFAGATFDGMTDCKHYHSDYVVTETEIKEIHYGADFVFCNRLISKQLGERVLSYLAAKYGKDWPDSVQVKEYEYLGGSYLDGASAIRPWGSDRYLDSWWNMTAHKMSASGCILELK